MVEQLKFLQEYMRPWLLEANLKASNIVKKMTRHAINSCCVLQPT